VSDDFDIAEFRLVREPESKFLERIDESHTTPNNNEARDTSHARTDYRAAAYHESASFANARYPGRRALRRSR
jgi:hypothetical protein